MVGIENGKVKAASLLEVTIAMVILGITISMGLIMFIRISASGQYEAKLRGHTLATNWMEKTLQERTLQSDREEKENLVLVREVTPYPGTRGVQVVEIKAMNLAGETLATVRQLTAVAP